MAQQARQEPGLLAGSALSLSPTISPVACSSSLSAIEERNQGHAER